MTRSTLKAIGTSSVVVALVAALIIPLGGVAAANHGTRTLDVEPEGSSQGVGTARVLTATISAAATSGTGTINIDFENDNGVNDSDGSSPETPDRTCSISSGDTNCTVSYTGTAIGNDTWRAWIDHDGLNPAQGGVVEADLAEGVNQATTPGSSPSSPQCAVTGNNEPDCTDVVSVTWTGGSAARLDCDDATGPDTEHETNPSGGGSASNESYVCTVTDAGGNAVSGVIVNAEVETNINDPDATDGISYATPDYTGTTAGTGKVTITVTQNENENGTAVVCFWIGDATAGINLCGANEPTNEGQNAAGADSANDLADQVEVSWQVRAATGVDAEPETDTNTLNANHVVTATVYDQFGDLFQGNTTVNLEFFDGSPSDTDDNDTTPPDKTCTTNNSSSCTITYTETTDGGIDAMCVWVATAPAMTGTSGSPSCDGEGLNDADDQAGSADAPEPTSDNQDVIQKIWQDPTAPTRLACTPETDKNPTGTAHTVTCTVTNMNGGNVASARVDAEATGTNDPDGANSQTSPDFTCTTAANGTCTFTHGPGGQGTTTSVGTTTYRAWIDIDNSNTTSEADATEAQDEGATAGATSEPDDTEVVTKTWTGPPTTLTISPATDTDAVGVCNAFTITAKDSAGTTVPGFKIDVEQTHSLANNAVSNDEPTVSFCTPAGTNPSGVDVTKGDLVENPDNKGTAGGETQDSTDANGVVTIGIRIAAGNASDGTGTVSVVSFYESTDNDDPNQGEAQATATKTWEIPDARTITCSPDRSSPTGTDTTVTCNVTDRLNQVKVNESVTFSETGVGDLIGPAVKTTDAQGTVSIASSSLQSGTQIISATITDDLEGAEPGQVDECDRAANDPSGAPAGTCADAVQITWTQAVPANVTVTPAEVTNDPGTPVTLTATVTAANGSPIAGIAVNWSERGPGALTDVDATTDANGQAQAIATSPDERGNQEVDVFTSSCVAGSTCTDTALLHWGPAACDIFGSEGNDILVGTAEDETICGFGGNDEINGGAGRDILLGEEGGDDLHGGSGDDILKGGADGDQLFGDSGGDQLRGGAGSDSLFGGQGRDVLKGGRGGDDIEGGDGVDLLVGGGGSDSLRGGADRDVLRGGAGKDVLDGGPETDSCKGGPGRDVETQCEG